MRRPRQFLESLMQDGPFSPGVAAELATALKQVGEVDRAEVFCQQALDAQPDHEGAQAVLIEIALGRGDVAAALVRSEAAVKGRPESRLLRHRHATCLQRSGRHQAASTILEALHAEHPTHRAFSLQLASVSRQLGKMDRAEALYLRDFWTTPRMMKPLRQVSSKSRSNAARSMLPYRAPRQRFAERPKKPSPSASPCYMPPAFRCI